jgi:hypothetical protein
VTLRFVRKFCVSWVNVPSSFRRPICDGSVPVNIFLCKLSALNKVNEPIQLGIVPDNTFSSKSKRCNDVALQIVLGIVPMMTLLLASIRFNFDSVPYEGGIDPDTIVLLLKLALTNWSNTANSGGKMPTRLLSSAVIGDIYVSTQQVGSLKKW